MLRPIEEIEPEQEIETTRYIVKEGDTLSNIAREYLTDSEVILKLNRITDPNHIWVGQKLKVPAID